MKEYFLLWVTHHGDDWKSTDRELFDTMEDLEDYKIQHEKEMEYVNGIEYISFDFSQMTDKQLRSVLTVSEYCELHPELDQIINQMFG